MAAARVGEADRAVEVAAGVDLDDPQARVLLVLGTDATVARTALHGLSLQPQRQLTGLVVALDLDVALGVAVHDGLEPAMLGTALAEEDLSGAADHLSLEYLPADGTDRPGSAPGKRSRASCAWSRLPCRRLTPRPSRGFSVPPA